MTPDGAVLDEPAELALLTGRHARYAAVHAFPLVDPETGRTIGMASWGNAILSREPLGDGFAAGLPRPSDDDVVEVAGALDHRTGAPHPHIGVPYDAVEPGHREPRCVVGGVVTGLQEPIAIATTHLTYIGRAQRRGQAEALAAIVGRVAASVPATIVTGDFNSAVDAPELTALSVDLTDAFAAIGLGAGDPARQTCDRQSIDHVRVRGLTVEGCRVVREAGDASDHWPVVADLVLQPH